MVCNMRTFLAVCGFAALLVAAPRTNSCGSYCAWAEPLLATSPGVEVGTVSQVEVNVRVVKAENDIDDGYTSPRLDVRLDDIRAKLEQLPFRHFSYLSSERVIIPIKRKQIVTFASGQTLALRPVYCEQEKIGLWLRWSEKNGDEILDTRLHVNPGESMLAGTDSSPTTGLILAIDVEPVSAP